MVESGRERARLRDRRAAVLCLLAAPLTLTATAACTGPTTAPVTSAAVISAPPGNTADPAVVAAARRSALAAYNGYLDAYVTAADQQDWNSKAIDKYTADPARIRAHLSLHDEADNNIVSRGKPVSTAGVTAVNVAHSPFSVAVTDCIDATDWKKYDQKKKVYVSQSPLRYSVTALVVQYPGIGWLVQQVDTTDKPC